jgi:general stress protein 26
MDSKLRHEFWEAFQKSPYIMLALEGTNEHSEPMTAMLDKEAHHAIWFYCARGNRIAQGGRAMGQVVTKGHDVFACLSGTLVEELDREVFEKHWSKPVEAWFAGGKDDPEIMMLRFDIDDAEVWTADLSLTGKFKLLTGNEIRTEEAGKHAVGAV